MELFIFFVSHFFCLVGHCGRNDDQNYAIALIGKDQRLLIIKTPRRVSRFLINCPLAIPVAGLTFLFCLSSKRSRKEQAYVCIRDEKSALNEQVALFDWSFSSEFECGRCSSAQTSTVGSISGTVRIRKAPPFPTPRWPLRRSGRGSHEPSPRMGTDSFRF